MPFGLGIQLLSGSGPSGFSIINILSLPQRGAKMVARQSCSGLHGLHYNDLI